MKTGYSLLQKTVVLPLIFSVSIGVSQQTYSVETLNEAITKAVQSSPDTMASWYGLQAAMEEERAARGGYYPSVDITGEVGRESSKSNIQSTDYYHPDSLRLTVTQMLFDGFETKNEVARLGFEKLASYYDFKSTSEDIASQVAAAYLDVMRYRELLELAKENYIQHRLIHNDITDRVDSGIGRRVDLDQASGRLALAESNLLTEKSNLHDVTARFYRLVGDVPGAILENPKLASDLMPADRFQTLKLAFENSPLLAASIERIRAARSEMKRKSSAYYPHFDLRIRDQVEHDQNGDALGFEEREEERAIELVMRYNLYRGGSDSASKRQSLARMEQARSLRDKACRDVRQEVSIAHNDVAALQEDVVYLDRNQAAINKAREAYRRQFDIGQRTLLDLLDTENEYFDVRRALVNAKTSLEIAKVRTLSGMGLFLKSRSISGYGYQNLNSIDLKKDMDDEDMRSTCMSMLPDIEVIDKDALINSLFDDPRFKKLEGGKASFNLDVKFDFNSDLIKSSEVNRIGEAASFLHEHKKVVGVVEGHTDSDGSHAYNQVLSDRRAKAVRRALIQDYGINETRLKARGYGEEKPIADNDTAQGKAENRRVELVMEAIVPGQSPKLSDFTSLNEDIEEIGTAGADTKGSSNSGW